MKLVQRFMKMDSLLLSSTKGCDEMLFLISLALSMMGLVSGLIIIPIVLIYETLKIILKK